MKYWKHHCRMIAKILSASYSYDKLNILLCYYKILLKSILHHKIHLRRQNSKILVVDILGLHIQFFNYAQLLNLFEEIFIFQVYRFQSHTTSPLIMDCGSNIGLSVLYFKKIFPSARILAFEPDGDTFKILEENMKRNELTNISLFNFALSDTEGEIDFYKNSALSGALNMSIVKSSDSDQSEKVHAKKLSNYVSEKIEMIKIDVEGAESKIIHDLIESNKINQVSAMIIEFHPNNSEYSLDELINRIKAVDFICHHPEIKTYPNAKDVLIYCLKNTTNVKWS